MSRRGCSLPANASGFDTHRDSISSRSGQAADLEKWQELLMAQTFKPPSWLSGGGGEGGGAGGGGGTGGFTNSEQALVTYEILVETGGPAPS
jgi:hypothetical protein